MNTGIDAVELMGRIDNLGESLKKAIGEFRYADALRISSERMTEIVRSAGRLEATAGRAA